MLSLHTAKKKTRPEEVFGGQRCFNSKTWRDRHSIHNKGLVYYSFFQMQYEL